MRCAGGSTPLVYSSCQAKGTAAGAAWQAWALEAWQGRRSRRFSRRGASICWGASGYSQGDLLVIMSHHESGCAGAQLPPSSSICSLLVHGGALIPWLPVFEAEQVPDASVPHLCGMGPCALPHPAPHLPTHLAICAHP